MEKRVAVVGGGYAGMAAAFALSEAGLPVTLFESSKNLGGRARGLDWKGKRIDNGQHILLGCYHDTLSLVEKACEIQDPFLRMPLSLSIDGFLLKPFPLFPPFDLLFGLLSAKGISFMERVNAVRFLARKIRLEKDLPVSKLLANEGQNDRISALLWHPLCLSALNTPPDEASASVFLEVLKDGLNGNGSDILIPKVDLSTLFPKGAARFIEKKGGKILTERPVRAIRKKGADFELFTDTETLSFSHAICAVAPQHLSRLLKEMPEIPVPGFDYQPICTVYSQYPEEIRLPGKMLGFSKRLCQWLFDRGQIDGQKGLISGVISATHPGISMDKIASEIHDAAASLIPHLPPPIWQKVIVEKRATFSCTVNLQRPQNATPVENFYLAGDYTEGPYPATIESAVRSGLACARSILDG